MQLRSLAKLALCVASVACAAACAAAGGNYGIKNSGSINYATANSVSGPAVATSVSGGSSVVRVAPPPPRRARRPIPLPSTTTTTTTTAAPPPPAEPPVNQALLDLLERLNALEASPVDNCAEWEAVRAQYEELAGAEADAPREHEAAKEEQCARLAELLERLNALEAGDAANIEHCDEWQSARDEYESLLGGAESPARAGEEKTAEQCAKLREFIDSVKAEIAELARHLHDLVTGSGTESRLDLIAGLVNDHLDIEEAAKLRGEVREILEAEIASNETLRTHYDSFLKLIKFLGESLSPEQAAAAAAAEPAGEPEAAGSEPAPALEEQLRASPLFAEASAKLEDAEHALEAVEALKQSVGEARAALSSLSGESASELESEAESLGEPEGELPPLDELPDAADAADALDAPAEPAEPVQLGRRLSEMAAHLAP